MGFTGRLWISIGLSVRSYIFQFFPGSTNWVAYLVNWIQGLIACECSQIDIATMRRHDTLHLICFAISNKDCN